MAHDPRNGYGTTLLCEASAEPDTLANKDGNRYACSGDGNSQRPNGNEKEDLS